MVFCYSTDPIEVPEWRSLELHDLCKIWPRMPTEEFERLRQSIVGSGLRFPIILCEGKILDGRHRFEICLAEDIEPRFETFMGPGSAMAFILDVNVYRRHLNTADIRNMHAEISRIGIERMGARDRQRYV